MILVSLMSVLVPIDYLLFTQLEIFLVLVWWVIFYWNLSIWYSRWEESHYCGAGLGVLILMWFPQAIVEVTWFPQYDDKIPDSSLGLLWYHPSGEFEWCFVTAEWRWKSRLSTFFSWHCCSTPAEVLGCLITGPQELKSKLPTKTLLMWRCWNMIFPLCHWIRTGFV